MATRSFVPPEHIILWPKDCTNADAICSRMADSEEYSENQIAQHAGIARLSVHRFVQRHRYKKESYKVARKLVNKGPVMIANQIVNAKYYEALDNGCYTVMDAIRDDLFGIRLTMHLQKLISKQSGIYITSERALEDFWIKQCT